MIPKRYAFHHKKFDYMVPNKDGNWISLRSLKRYLLSIDYSEEAIKLMNLIISDLEHKDK